MAMYVCTKFQLIWRTSVLEPNLPKKHKDKLNMRITYFK